MPDNSSAGDLLFRNWQLDRASDKQFTRVVPHVKWDFFAARLRPLTDECSTGLRERLFSGVIHPFDYKRAKGWMGKILQTARSSSDRKLPAVEALTATFSGKGRGSAFVIYHYVDHPVYAAEPAVMIDCLERGWLMINDTFVLCHEQTQNVALYWEGSGPIFGKRGDRRLI